MSLTFFNVSEKIISLGLAFFLLLLFFSVRAHFPIQSGQGYSKREKEAERGAEKGPLWRVGAGVELNLTGGRGGGGGGQEEYEMECRKGTRRRRKGRVEAGLEKGKKEREKE